MPLRHGEISWMNGRLTLSKPIEGNTSRLLLIIVPESLRRTVCNIYHASPAGGHVGQYKTLYRLRIRFFWPKMRTFIESFVAKCPHCVLTNSRRHTASELMHSWPLDGPFSIVHVDLWNPGETTDYMKAMRTSSMRCAT